MSLIEQKLETKVQFWALIGPFTVITTLIVGLLRDAPSGYALPLAALVGVPACWRWRVRGMITALVIMATISILTLHKVPALELWWHIGILAAMMLGLVITTLGFEEVADTLRHVSVESKGHRENWIGLDQQLRMLQEERQKEREQLKQISEELAGAQRTVATFQEQQEAWRCQMDQLSSQRELLKSELQQVQEEAWRSAQEVVALSKDLQQQAEFYTVRQIEGEKLFQAQVEQLQKEALAREVEPTDALYKQLRAQFEEKKAKLQETRVELFRREGQMHLLALALAETKLVPRAIEQDLQQALTQTMQEVEKLEKENHLLQEIVSKLV